MTHPQKTFSRRPLYAMAVAYLLLVVAALGTGSLWPVYITRLGGGPSASGIFNAAGNLTGIAGTLWSGWLAGRVGRRRLFYVGSALFAASWLLMTRATTWQQLTLANLLGGFAFCVAINMIVILTGLLADESERGRSFGLLTVTMGVGQMLGGMVCGPIADRFGFNTLFMIDTALCLGAMLPGLLFVEPALGVADAGAETLDAGAGTEAGPYVQPRRGAGDGFSLIIVATLLTSAVTFGGSLGRSIVMDQIGFSATAISLAAAIGGAVGLPMPLVMGWLSDRFGRKRLLLGSLGTGVLALLGFAYAGPVWAFWGASVLLALTMSASPLLQALATDLLPPASVGTGLSLLSGASSTGLFVSSLGMGVAIQGLGGRNAFLISALAPLAALALVAAVREQGRAGATPGERFDG